MLKVRLNCPVCGIPIMAKSLEGHLKHAHELTGTVTLRLNPTNPYAHEPEPEEKPEDQPGDKEPEEKEPAAPAPGEKPEDQPGDKEPREKEPEES